MDPILTEYRYDDQRTDCLKQTSDLLLAPLRLSCGRVVQVSSDASQIPQDSLHLVSRIFLGLLALLILPFTLK